MKISVIIPTLNAEKFLPALLGRLSSQTFTEKELLIVDSDSDDRTLEIASSFGAKTITISRKDFNHGHTRNLAAEASSGDYLVFLTQDVLPVNNELISYLVMPLEKEETIAVAYGRQIACDNAHAIEKFIRTFNYPEVSSTRDLKDVQRLGVKAFFCSNACSIYRRDVFRRLGGFRDDTIMNEDMEFVYRAVLSGCKVHYASDAKVFHSHDYTLTEQFKRYIDIGVFFANNQELASYSRNEEEGKRYIKEALGFLLKNDKANEVVPLLFDSAARFIGYRVGFNYRVVPVSIIKRLSMNKNYWLSQSQVPEDL